MLASGRGRKTVARLEAEGLVAVRERLPPASGLARRSFLRLRGEPGSDLTRPEARVVELLRELDRGGGVARAEIARRYPGCATGIRRLTEKGLAELFEKTVFRDPVAGDDLDFPAPKRLTPDQEQVLAALVPAVRRQEYAAFLLHGVTGSGKTEVYLRAAAAARR